MKRRLLFLTACLGAFLPAAALQGCNKKEPIRVGFIAGLTGRAADLGVAGRNGALLAVEERNAAGGIRGRLVELVVRNDGQDPETARKAAAELISMNMEATIGPMTSSVAMAVVPLFNASAAILVSPTATTAELTGKDDNFLRIVSSTAGYAAKSARSQVAGYGRRKVAAIHDVSNASYTQSWLDDFRGTLEGMGGRLVKSVPYRSGDDSVFYPLVRDLIRVRPDLVLVITNAVDAALICQQIRKLDGELPVFISEWAGTERFVELAGTASEGVFVSQLMNRGDSSPRFQAFLGSYRERYGQDPGWAGMAGYDAALVTLEALARRQPGKSLKETIIAAGALQGAQRTISIDRFGDAGGSSFVTVVRQGQYITLE